MTIENTRHVDGLGWDPEEFLRKLQWHLLWAHTRVEIFRLISEARRSEATRGALKVGSLFFLLAEDAFYLDAALTVYKLFSNDERGLMKYLNKCRHDYKYLSVDENFLSQAELTAHIERVKELKRKPVFAKFKDLRDKWLAHHDSEAFDHPEQFFRDHFVTAAELASYVEAAQDIMRQHWLAYGSGFSPGLPREDDVLSLIDILWRYDEIDQLLGDQRINDSEAAKRMFHYQKKLPELRELFGRPDPNSIWENLFGKDTAG